jgi:nucleotide-binding universal stress UspA family protein|tara:strand:+ start:2032 stop:2838 length:807 start_codon:yes stop_codon:yes gene_type:complete
MSKNLYIVLHDFTEIGDTALDYALHLAKHVHTDIKMMHVVNDSSKEIQATSKLMEIITKKSIPEGVTLSPLVKVGNFIEDMNDFVKDESAQLVIMGTHGALGLQKLFGSHAIKMIRHSDVPFLVVQKGTPLKEIENIIVPVDLTKESLQIVNIAGDMATIVGGTVHILYEDQNDERLSMTMKNRIHIVKNNYEERNVKAEFVKLESKGSYIKKIEAYAHELEAELLAFSYHSESILPQFETFGQSLITNSLNLPCMVVNSKLASALYF